jgi:hypothetical protein
MFASSKLRNMNQVLFYYTASRDDGRAKPYVVSRCKDATNAKSMEEVHCKANKKGQRKNKNKKIRKKSEKIKQTKRKAFHSS